MGGQNNLPADTGRSDLRTRGVSEGAGRGPGPWRGGVFGGGGGGGGVAGEGGGVAGRGTDSDGVKRGEKTKG